LKIISEIYSWNDLPINCTITNLKVKFKSSTYFFGLYSEKFDEDQNFFIYDLKKGNLKQYPYKANEITHFDASLAINYCAIVKNFAEIELYWLDNENYCEMKILKELKGFEAPITQISFGNFDGNQHLIIGHKDGTLSSYNIITQEFYLKNSRINNSSVLSINRINDYNSINRP